MFSCSVLDLNLIYLFKPPLLTLWCSLHWFLVKEKHAATPAIFKRLFFQRFVVFWFTELVLMPTLKVACFQERVHHHCALPCPPLIYETTTVSQRGRWRSWPVIDCNSNVNLNVNYIWPPATFSFCWANTTYLPFCLWPSLQANLSLYLLLSSPFVMSSAATAW